MVQVEHLPCERGHIAAHELQVGQIEVRLRSADQVAGCDLVQDGRLRSGRGGLIHLLVCCQRLRSRVRGQIDSTRVLHQTGRNFRGCADRW